MFIAACISASFIEQDIEIIIKTGLSIIPSDCEYYRMSQEVIQFYHEHPEDWRRCFKFVKDNFGYDRYPGACHIIPNSAVIILSLLYSDGDFSKAINICIMCGWDTDCNVANVGTIMGVRNGLKGIDYKKWRKPINDFLACSRVIGSLNIMDIPWAAAYIANLAYKIAEEEPPAQWKTILEEKAAKFHFEFPGSTHSFRICSDIEGSLEYNLCHTTEEVHSGTGALKVVAKPLMGGKELRIFHKTYYRPKDFHDSRYDPSFSPILYPGQMVTGYVMVPKETTFKVLACLYVKDGNSQKYIKGKDIQLIPGVWEKLSFGIPHIDSACLEEAGVLITPMNGWHATLVAYLDDFDFSGRPDYNIEFSKERMEVWNTLHQEVSQFTYLKGIWTLEDGLLSGSCCDFGEAYTGGYDWKNYCFQATLIPQTGEYHNINFRVEGAIRSYAVGLAPQNKLAILKNKNGYRTLKEIDFPWENGKEYTLKVEVKGPKISIIHDGQVLMEYIDQDKPYLYGQIGASVRQGSHCHYKSFMIHGIE